MKTVNLEIDKAIEVPLNSQYSHRIFIEKIIINSEDKTFNCNSYIEITNPLNNIKVELKNFVHEKLFAKEFNIVPDSSLSNTTEYISFCLRSKEDINLSVELSYIIFDDVKN